MLSALQLTRWIFVQALHHQWLFGIRILSMLLQILLALLGPWPMAFAVDYALRKREMSPGLARFITCLPGATTPIGLVDWSIAVTLLFFLCQWLVQLANDYTTVTICQRMSYDLASDVLAKLQELSLATHAKKSIGDNFSSIVNDCYRVSMIFRDGLLPVMWATISLTAMLGVLLQISLLLTLPLAGVGLLMIIVVYHYSHLLRYRSLEQRRIYGSLSALVEGTFSAMPAVQAFQRETANDRCFARENRKLIISILSFTRAQIQMKLLLGLVATVGTISILLLGAREITAGSVGLGEIFVFFSYLTSIYRPLQSVMRTGSTIQGLSGSADRVWAILQTETDIKEKPDGVMLSKVKGHLKFENVAFGYEAERTVLREITLEVFPGETVALVGPTGVGKTTLIHLLFRFFDPWKGDILIDGINLRDIQLKSLRQNISLVMQQSFLFSMSIADNIAYGRPTAGMAKIEAAARAAHAHDFIARLPNGYDTKIAENGASLSGGERQRICIARAILKDAPIVLLDEPSSDLDSLTEQQVVEGIENLTKNRTTLIAAHRLSTIRRVHRIVVLDQGKISKNRTL